MKYSIVILAFITISTVSGIPQTPLADADPVLQGTATYKMPQSAIDAEIDGKVVMAIHVDKTGKPTKASVAAGPMWPCSTTPRKELDELFSDLSEKMLELKFSAALKEGKLVDKDIGLGFYLKNPKLDPKPVEIDLIKGKPIAEMINAGIINGKAVSLPKPNYPAEAKAHRDGGKVSIQVILDEQGKVLRAGAIDGPPRLQYASREAACGARFAPTTLEGKSVKVSGILHYMFIPG